MEAWLSRFRGQIIGIALAALATGGGLLLLRPPAAASLTIRTPSPSPTVTQSIKVHVSGAVRSPGVYTFRPGDRVEDAIAAAGGATADGDANALNLAARLADGQQVAVPRHGEPAPTAAAGTGQRLISINTATLAELDTLPGIGPVTGQKIIDYRLKNGPFQRVEDLRDLKIVPASTFDKIKDLLTL